MERFEPVPVPRGDGRHDIGDDVRAAIVERLTFDWSRDPDLAPDKVRQLAMWAAASVRSLIHELGTLRDLSAPPPPAPEREEALSLTGVDGEFCYTEQVKPLVERLRADLGAAKAEHRDWDSARIQIDTLVRERNQLRERAEQAERTLAAAVSLAKGATNGWACYAKRQIEHAEIARLHREIDQLSAAARPPQE